MTETISEVLAAVAGTRLDQPQYQQDFDANLWQVDGADSWKLERLQNYSEAGFPSWEAFMAGDWDSALKLHEEERPKIAAFYNEFRRHRSRLYRIRIVTKPMTPYLQWEMHCLRLRAECGERIRVVNQSAVSQFESTGILPELVSLCGRVLYRTIYDGDQKPDGAIRYSDPETIARYEHFAHDLYETGEDIASYFWREIAELPPPRL